jgi:APA family basic amino acid/polyamine antiporter
VALGVGGTIGGGIYVLVGRAVAQAGPAAVVSFAVAFAASLLIALPYAELASRYPRAGGAYAFVRAVFGSRAAFMMGWGFWGAYLLISGYVTLGFGGYLHALTGLPVVVGAIGLIVACLSLNLLGVRIAGAGQLVVIGVAIVGLVVFVAWGAASVKPSHFHPLLARGAPGVVLAALPAFLAFGGFDMVAAAGEEIHDPARNLPRAILITLGLVLGLYLAVCAVATGALGAGALGASRAPLADAALSFGGAPARAVVLSTALLTTAATANAVLIVTSRISFAMARDALLPRALARLSGRTGTPWAALVASAVLLCLVAATGSVALAASAGGFLYVLHFLLPLIALALLRRRGESAGDPAFRTPAPRWTLSLAFLACAVLIAGSGWSGIAAGATWLAIGAVGYAIAARHRAALRRPPSPPAPEVARA